MWLRNHLKRKENFPACYQFIQLADDRIKQICVFLFLVRGPSCQSVAASDTAEAAAVLGCPWVAFAACPAEVTWEFGDLKSCLNSLSAEL